MWTQKTPFHSNMQDAVLGVQPLDFLPSPTPSSLSCTETNTMISSLINKPTLNLLPIYTYTPQRNHQFSFLAN